MHVDELRGKRIAIWGYAREGQAALRFLRDRGLDATILDDNIATPDAPLISGRDAIAQSINDFDVVVKSPGISLYDPLVTAARAAGVRFTSLLNLWFGADPQCTTICVTGTKGKSTTTALIAHILRDAGRNAMAAGNIGVPVTELPRDGLDAAIIEVSSYQAADFAGTCDIAVLTSLSQEHLDWHGSVEAYQRDKLNLLRHARRCLSAAPLSGMDCTLFAPQPDQHLNNSYLSRPHNRLNLAGAIAVAGLLGISTTQALAAAESFPPLPHRQQEIGEVAGVLYVDDSISTTPEAALAALDVYRNRTVTLILGGHDRGIDYTPLIERLCRSPVHALILLDVSGRRIHRQIPASHLTESMQQAVSLARSLTPRGGVILLSPAAPSYGTYRSFIERGQDFARCAGLAN